MFDKLIRALCPITFGTSFARHPLPSFRHKQAAHFDTWYNTIIERNIWPGEKDVESSSALRRLLRDLQPFSNRWMYNLESLAALSKNDFREIAMRAPYLDEHDFLMCKRLSDGEWIRVIHCLTDAFFDCGRTLLQVLAILPNKQITPESYRINHEECGGGGGGGGDGGGGDGSVTRPSDDREAPKHLFGTLRAHLSPCRLAALLNKDIRIQSFIMNWLELRSNIYVIKKLPANACVDLVQAAFLAIQDTPKPHPIDDEPQMRRMIAHNLLVTGNYRKCQTQLALAHRQLKPLISQEIINSLARIINMGVELSFDQGRAKRIAVPMEPTSQSIQLQYNADHLFQTAKRDMRTPERKAAPDTLPPIMRKRRT